MHVGDWVVHLYNLYTHGSINNGNWAYSSISADVSNKIMGNHSEFAKKKNNKIKTSLMNTVSMFEIHYTCSTSSRPSIYIEKLCGSGWVALVVCFLSVFFFWVEFGQSKNTCLKAEGFMQADASKILFVIHTHRNFP